MAIRKCIGCGAILGDGLSTCPYCGAPNPTSGNKKSNHQATYQTNQSYKSPQGSYYSGPTKNQPTIQRQPRKSNGAWKRVLICLAVIVVAVVGFFAIRHFTKPGELYVSRNNGAYELTWEKPQNATLYEIYINDQKVGESTEPTFDITQYLIADTKYDIEVKCRDEQGTEVKSYQYDYSYQAQTANDFKRKRFFMNGAVYDYHIDSIAEYEVFVWYNILYRQNNVRCYISTPSIDLTNINSRTVKAINAYPEYDAVKTSSRYATMTGSIGQLINFKYYLPKDFTLTTANTTDYSLKTFFNGMGGHFEKDTGFNVAYEETSDAGSPRNFPIDSLTTEVLVYNTEQLNMVTTYGAKPVFANQNSVAATVYKNARDVLAQINSDNLTDYQKALNIYRYLCMNVTYDHILLSYMTMMNDSTVVSFGKYNVFYLEGVFLDMDNQVAVCDGIAKAFALMCNIEGISASKINGSANTGTGAGMHAWNRVYLNSNWYIVDATWGVASYATDDNQDGEADNYFEAFTHSYFLVSESEISNTHTALYDISSAPTVSYNFYKNTTVSATKSGNTVTLDLYIENDTDLKNLKTYMYYSGRNSIDVQFSQSYLQSMCTGGYVNDTEITQYLKKYTLSDPYAITGWINYSRNVFLLKGAVTPQYA